MLIVAAASFLPFFGSAIYYNSAIELPNSFGIFDMKTLSYYYRLTVHTIIKPVFLKRKILWHLQYADMVLKIYFSVFRSG